MGRKITLTKDEAQDAMGQLDPVKIAKWDWGTRDSYVIEKDQILYMFTLEIHNQEGIQWHGDTVEAIEVQPVTTITYKPVK